MGTITPLRRASLGLAPVAPVAPIALVALVALVAGCAERPGNREDSLGTPQLREALFDSILAMTARREAFSQPKHEALGYDPLEEMEKLRDAVVNAATADDFFYALVALSNARRDRHLSVGLVPGGLRPAFVHGLEAWEGPDPPDPRHAPIRIRPDYGEDRSGYFVADRAEGWRQEGARGSVAEGAADGAGEGAIALGDRIIGVNGRPVDSFQESALPFIRHSTVAGFRWKLAEALPRATALFPPGLLGDSLLLELRGRDGRVRNVALPYLDADDLNWGGASEPRYPGFALEWSTPTFDLYLPRDGRRLVLLQWHRFESSSLMADVDRLVAQARADGFLDHALILDATRSGGGSLGAYAVQRIQPRPFTTTFGTVRISDAIPPFIEGKEADFQEDRIYDGGGPEVVDDGTWLMDWIRTDLAEAMERGDSVTVPVPFKLAHAPKDSDGVLQPAPVHFTGPLVVFSGPHGGSHLDQFMSIVVDNDLGYVIGMPAGGYSNTWEWEEVLTFPGTEQPVVGFMWSIGHTIRPNGEVLEGNPADVHEWLPLTAENSSRYHDLLLDAALRHLASVGYGVGG